jgi:hypothetical protein
MSASARAARRTLRRQCGSPAISGEDRSIGLEYYADYGKVGNILPLQQQNQQLYAVTDFKVKDVDVELGAGYGFTPGSDRLIFKAILGYAFPGPNRDDSGGSNSSMTMGTQPRTTQNSFFCEIGPGPYGGEDIG